MVWETKSIILKEGLYVCIKNVCEDKFEWEHLIGNPSPQIALTEQNLFLAEYKLSLTEHCLFNTNCIYILVSQKDNEIKQRIFTIVAYLWSCSLEDRQLNGSSSEGS